MGYKKRRTCECREADDIYVHNQDWIIGYEDDEQTVMYYTKPLAPEQTTTNFMDGIHFKESMGNGFADAVYTLEYEVTAVQANNAKMRSQQSLACSRSLMKMERFCLFQKQDNG